MEPKGEICVVFHPFIRYNGSLRLSHHDAFGFSLLRQKLELVQDRSGYDIELLLLGLYADANPRGLS